MITVFIFTSTPKLQDELLLPIIWVHLSSKEIEFASRNDYDLVHIFQQCYLEFKPGCWLKFIIDLLLIDL